MSYGQVNADVIGTSVANSSLGAGNATLMKNKIINGACVIDQRNAGASITNNSASFAWGVDRMIVYGTQTSKFTSQQNAGSVTPPIGFTNYLGITSLSAYSVTSTDWFAVSQRIEGFNTADLQWGTANAKTVTLSFQVYSSLTGTFGGVLTNSAQNRSYPFTYTVSSANTWTSIAITVAGDTSGTWVGATNGTGIAVVWGLGVGSTLSGTVGSWAGANYYSATGAVSVVGTSGATFYITGVQLEVGSSATGFEYRQYGQELALCQRYYETSYNGVKVPTNASGSLVLALTVGSQTYAGGAGGAQQVLGSVPFAVVKRASPTINIYSYISSILTAVSSGYSGSDFAANSGNIYNGSAYCFSIFNATGSNITTTGYSVIFGFSASAEL